MSEQTKHIEVCQSEQVGAEIVNAATGDKFDALVTEAWTGEQPAQPYTSLIVEFKSLLILFLRKLYYTPLSLFSNTSIKDFISGLQATIVTLQAAIASMLGDIATSYQKVSEKGGTLPQEQTSANLPAAIASIPSGGSPYDALSELGFTQADIELLDGIETPTQDEINAAKLYMNREGAGWRAWQGDAYKPLRYIPAYKVTNATIQTNLYNDYACEIYGGIITTQALTTASPIVSGCYALKYFCGTELDLRQCTSFQEAFSGCYSLVRIPKIRLSSLCSASYDMYRSFYNCYALREVDFGDSDTSNVTNMEWLFYNCCALKVVKGIIDCTSVLSNRYAIAPGCYNLVEIRFKNVGGNLNLSSSTFLSYDSLLYLVQNLQNVSGKTLTIGTTNKNKLNATTDGQNAIAAAQAIGWTIS